MEQVKKLSKQVSLNKVRTLLEKPFAVIIIGFILVSYISTVAHRLPKAPRTVFSNPLSKIVIFFIILGLHKIDPILSVISAIIFMVLIQISVMRDAKPVIKLAPIQAYKVVPDDEAAQIILEAEEELQKPKSLLSKVKQVHLAVKAKVRANAIDEAQAQAQAQAHAQVASDVSVQRQMEQSEPIERPANVDALHPINRPSEMTMMTSYRIEDPDHPNHPGWTVLKDPEINVAIYELNPPYARKDTVEEDCKRSTINQSSINVPKGGPTRYSAMHGYYLS